MVKPLWAVEAERGIAGHLFAMPETVDICAEQGLMPAAFLDETCRAIYVMALEMRRKGLRVEPTSFWEYAADKDRQDLLTAIVEYITDPKAGLDPLNLGTWIKIVQQREEQRAVFMFLGACNGSESFEDIERKFAEAREEFNVGRDKRISGPEVFNADDLLKRVLPPVRWAIPGLLPEGLTLFVGKSKQGKSWMALGLLVACAVGGKALGQLPMEPGDCLYLALEDNARRLQSRCQALVEQDRAYNRLHIALEWPRVDQGGLELLRAWLVEHPEARLICIDTLKKIRPEGNKDQSVYDRDYESIEGLQRLAAEFHVAIVVIHHMRKLAADDPVDSINGSAGLPASADGLWIFDRNRRESDATLFVVHREGEGQEIALSWDDGTKTWNHRGDAEEYRGSKERKEIWDFVKSCPQPVGPKEVAENLGRNYHTTKNLMTKMVAEGSLSQVGRGLYKIDATALTRGNKSDTSVVEGPESGEKVLQFPQRDAKNPSTTAKTTDGSDRSLSVVDSTTEDYGKTTVDHTPVVEGSPHVDAENGASEESKTTDSAFLVPGFEEDDEYDDLAGIDEEDPF